MDALKNRFAGRGREPRRLPAARGGINNGGIMASMERGVRPGWLPLIAAGAIGLLAADQGVARPRGGDGWRACGKTGSVAAANQARSIIDGLRMLILDFNTEYLDEELMFYRKPHENCSAHDVWIQLVPEAVVAVIPKAPRNHVLAVDGIDLQPSVPCFSSGQRKGIQVRI